VLILFKCVFITDYKALHTLESELLPDFGEILFHTDMDNGCSSMTWKYREQRIIDGLSVMPVPFSISAEYDMLDHNFQVFHVPVFFEVKFIIPKAKNSLIRQFSLFPSELMIVFLLLIKLLKSVNILKFSD